MILLHLNSNYLHQFPAMLINDQPFCTYESSQSLLWQLYLRFFRDQGSVRDDVHLIKSVSLIL